jgi:WD40 repeat protein
MIRVTVPRLKYWLAVAIAFGGMALAACQRMPRWVGLDTVSPDGRWATIVEQSAPATLRLLQLDMETGEATLLAEDIAAYSPGSSFSPDGRYVVYRARGGWWLRDLTAGEPITVSEGVEALEFLPTGELLVTSLVDGLKQFETASPSDPRIRTFLQGRILYRFSDQPPDPALLDDASQLICARPPTSTVQSQWVTIDADGAVSVLTATRDDVQVRRLAPRLSDRVTELLERQAVTMESWLAEEKKKLEKDIKEYADSQEGVSFSDEDMDALLEELLAQRRSSFMGLTLFGTISPDGNRLLFLRAVPGGGDKKLHSLYLIDLTTDADPKVLSSETEWIPGYAFSPDGRRILFQSNRDGGRTLYLANADGGDIHPIVEQGVLNPCWH